jgi:large subunit ribosomal protein L17
MRQGKSGSKLGRTSSHRKAMLRNMVTSFLKYEMVKTTDVKAKELKRVAEKMITLGKRGDLHARRQALAFVRDPSVVGKLFSDLSERYRERAGGYTRIVKMGFRIGDNAPLSMLEFIDAVQRQKPKKKSAAAS